ncbi:peptidoglycan recognition protein family protein [Saccharopolyspora taberi]|uniref:N-acetylmuramoyl-L-alanine amidase domain-containing protein n=1 Tax=Saccharopolyspora taberi TaxID=60895 RepID=A0ABN3VM55_9PSEU
MTLDLAGILRAAGLGVVATPGWAQRGVRGTPPAPVGVLNHHTATPSSDRNPAPSVQLTIGGRSDLLGPLCHIVIGADGTSHIIAAGRANHAGKAKASGPNPAGDGNTLYLGVEWDYDGTHPPSPAQYNAAVQVNAALLRHLGRPAEAARGHKETSVTGKIDPAHVDMDRFRADVARAMAGGPADDGGLESMALDTRYRDWAGNEQTVQSFMDNVDRRLAALEHIFLKPGSEPSRIPGDKNRTNLRDAIMDTTAKVVEIQREIGRPAPWPEPLPSDNLTPPAEPVASQPESPQPQPEGARPEQSTDKPKSPAPKPSRKPGRTVAAGGAAGAAGTVAVWIASLYGVQMPEPVAAAIALVLTAGMSYLVPSPAPQHREAPRR